MLAFPATGNVVQALDEDTALRNAMAESLNEAATAKTIRDLEEKEFAQALAASMSPLALVYANGAAPVTEEELAYRHAVQDSLNDAFEEETRDRDALAGYASANEAERIRQSAAAASHKVMYYDPSAQEFKQEIANVEKTVRALGYLYEEKR